MDKCHSALPAFTYHLYQSQIRPKDHYDRIDFVYFKGKGVKLDGAKIVGESKENADIIVSPYPSDHCAVIATFTLPNQSKSEKLDANKPDAGEGK